MAEKNEESATFFLENSESAVADEHTKESDGNAKNIIPNKTKIENPSAQNTKESTKPKSGNQSPVQLGQRTSTKIPIMATGSKKNMNISATKANTNSSVKIQSENGCKIGVGGSKTEPFYLGEHEDREQPKNRFKSRDELQNELFEKIKQIDSLKKQLDDLKVSFKAQNAEKQDNSVDSELTEKTTNDDGEG